jgi:hypothetical protein
MMAGTGKCRQALAGCGSKRGGGNNNMQAGGCGQAVAGRQANASRRTQACSWNEAQAGLRTHGGAVSSHSGRCAGVRDRRQACAAANRQSHRYAGRLWQAVRRGKAQACVGVGTGILPLAGRPVQLQALAGAVRRYRSQTHAIKLI